MYLTYYIVYVFALDPLRHFPGPKINAISRIPYIRHLLAGTTVENAVSLHQHYGDGIIPLPQTQLLILISFLAAVSLKRCMLTSGHSLTYTSCSHFSQRSLIHLN